MKWLVVLALALTAPVLADGHCKDIAKELERAADRGTISRRTAKNLIRRCYKTKDWRHDSSKVHQTNEKSR